MMKKVFLLCFLIQLLCSVTLINAQYFQGKVIDEKNLAVSGASIYFNSTNLGTVSSASGTFKIKIPDIENKLLVISFLGYENIFINQFETQNQTFKLIPKIDELKEILISESYFSRKQLLEAFKKEFLGDTYIGKRCEILNEDDIKIKFDTKTNTLSAFSKEDLVVLNPVLNYKIRFNLIDFEAKYNIKSLKNKYLIKSFFVGTSYYQNDVKPTFKHINKRQIAFEGSIQHFFKSLSILNFDVNQFIIAKNGFKVNPIELLKITRVDDNFMLKLGKSDFLKNKNVFEQLGREIPYEFKISVLYKNKKQTDIKFTKNQIYFDGYGNYSPVKNVILVGEMAKGKLGSMLPANYEYIPNKL